MRKGEKMSNEQKIKISLSEKGKIISFETREKMKRNNKSALPEIRKKRSETNKRLGIIPPSRLGIKHTEETKQKISINHKGLNTWIKGTKLSEKHKQKLSIAHKGRKHTEETKRKMRLSAFEYAKKITGIICPRMGYNEKQILDKLEQELNYKIIRQHKCNGYFIDGYIPELRLAIEIDERPKNTERDMEREKNIKERLSCELLRIKDYE